jgi:hypothetical protein
VLWIILSLTPVEAFVSRIASFDKRTVRATKERINRTGIPNGNEFAGQQSRILSNAEPAGDAKPPQQASAVSGTESGAALHPTFGKALKSLGSSHS